MTWSLFLDDLREPNYVGKTYFEVKVARNVEDAIEMVESYGMPEHVYFDNDLGEDELEGKDLAKWFIEQFLDGKLRPVTRDWFTVHSSNPPAKLYINGLLSNYMRMEYHE